MVNTPPVSRQCDPAAFRSAAWSTCHSLSAPMAICASFSSWTLLPDTSLLVLSHRLGRDAARVVLLVFAAELPHSLVVTLGEHGPQGFAHARDHGDSRPGKPAPGQFVAGAVL